MSLYKQSQQNQNDEQEWIEISRNYNWVDDCTAKLRTAQKEGR